MSSQFDYDLIVIGAGSGGVRAGRIAAGYGARVAVIEGDRPGGTCVIRGCVPKKLLVYGASFAGEAEDAAGFGWQIEGISHSWPKLIAAKDKEIARLEGIYRNLLKSTGADLIEGWGRLAGPHEVAVGDKIYTAERILIATGGRSATPAIPGLAEFSISSNEALDLPERPDHIVVYGGGYIALEFAGIFAGLGSQVDLVYRADLPLRGFDEDVRQHIAEALADRGINLVCGRVIAEVKQSAKGYQVILDDGQIINPDAVMAATGRTPNIDGLGLEAAGVITNQRGAIQVDEWSQTSTASIFAVGDVTDRINLTPVAIAEGHAFADTVYGGMPRNVSYDAVPSAVFSQPNIACVGLTEEQAEATYGAVQIFESRFRAMKNTLSGRPEKTYMKLIVSDETQTVLGVHMVGPDAAEIMQGMAIAVKMGARKADFDAVIGIHPSAAEEFVTMRSPRS
ncbi:MAG: glutathione-disulfide reductase [Candidatus Puniceispirillaceae bacterium]